MAKTALEIVLVDDGSPAASRQPGPPVDTPRVSAASRGTPAANEKPETPAPASATAATESRADNPIARQAGQVASALEEVEDASLPLSSAFSELTIKVERLSKTLDDADTDRSESQASPSGANKAARSRASGIRGPRVGAMGAIAAGLSNLGVAAGLASVALAGTAAAAGTLVLAFRRVSQRLETEVERLGKYSPEIEIARAEADIARQQQELLAANKLGPDLAEFVRAQSRLELQSFQLRMRLVRLMIKLYGLIQPVIKLFVRIGELLIDALQPAIKLLHKIEEILEPLFAKIRKWLGIEVDEDKPNNFLDDPFLRDWLGELPKPPPPGANGGNGGVP